MEWVNDTDSTDNSTITRRKPVTTKISENKETVGEYKLIVSSKQTHTCEALSSQRQPLPSLTQ